MVTPYQKTVEVPTLRYESPRSWGGVTRMWVSGPNELDVTGPVVARLELPDWAVTVRVRLQPAQFEFDDSGLMAIGMAVARREPEPRVVANVSLTPSEAIWVSGCDWTTIGVRGVRVLTHYLLAFHTMPLTIISWEVYPGRLPRQRAWWLEDDPCALR